RSAWRAVRDANCLGCARAMLFKLGAIAAARPRRPPPRRLFNWRWVVLRQRDPRSATRRVARRCGMRARLGWGAAEALLWRRGWIVAARSWAAGGRRGLSEWGWYGGQRRLVSAEKGVRR